MIPISTTIVLIVGAFLIALFPILLFLKLKKHGNKLFVPLIAGMLSFFVPQMLIRIPIIQGVLPRFEWYTSMNMVMLILFLAFTAGLFETMGRFVTMKWMLSKDRRFLAGFAHGIGHGGIEAIILVGMNFLIYGVIAIWMMTSSYQTTIMEMPIIEESLEPLRHILEITPWYEFLLGVMERVSTIIIHITLSVITMYGLYKKQGRYVVIVLLIHTFLDFTSVYLLHIGVNMFIVELYILLLAIIGVIIIKYIYNDYINTATKRKEESYET